MLASRSPRITCRTLHVMLCGVKDHSLSSHPTVPCIPCQEACRKSANHQISHYCLLHSPHYTDCSLVSAHRALFYNPGFDSLSAQESDVAYSIHHYIQYSGSRLLHVGITQVSTYSTAMRTEIEPLVVCATIKSWSYEMSSLTVSTSLALG